MCTYFNSWNSCEGITFYCGSAGKESACNVGDLGLILGLGRSSGEGKGYPLQYSGLEKNSMGQSMGSQRVRHNWATLIFQTNKYIMMTDQGLGSKWCRMIVNSLSAQLISLSTPGHALAMTVACLKQNRQTEGKGIPWLASPGSLPWLEISAEYASTFFSSWRECRGWLLHTHPPPDLIFLCAPAPLPSQHKVTPHSLSQVIFAHIVCPDSLPTNVTLSSILEQALKSRNLGLLRDHSPWPAHSPT